MVNLDRLILVNVIGGDIDKLSISCNCSCAYHQLAAASWSRTEPAWQQHMRFKK